MEEGKPFWERYVYEKESETLYLRQENTALWQVVEAVAHIDGPLAANGDMDNLICIFCEEAFYYSSHGLEGTHKPDCTYLKAKKLVAERKMA